MASARISNVAAATAVLALAALPGCGRDDQAAEPIQATTGALVATGQLWPLSGGTHIIPVCWETGLSPDGTGQAVNPHTRQDWPTLSATVRDTMRRTWGRVANIEFTWFDDCPSNTPAGNGGYISINMGGGNNASCGETMFGYNGPNYWTRMRLDTECGTDPTLDPWLDFQGEVMHETGHALGFNHENDRADNPRNTGCQVADNNHVGNHGPYYGTQFDLHSIMNYSYDNGPAYCQLPRPYRLSEWDIIGAQNAYGRRTPGELVAATGSCVDIPMAYGDGEALQIYECHTGANQAWQLQPLGSFYGRIYNQTSLAYAEVHSFTGVGQQVAVGGFLAPAMTQSWSPPAAGYQIRGIGDMCLDVPSAQIFNHQSVQIYSCNGGSNQLWKTYSDGTIRPAANTSFCLDVPNGSAVSGKALQLYTCNGNASQKFTLPDTAQIKYQGLCLDVRYATPSSGNPLQLYSCKSAGDLSRVNQLWHLTMSLSPFNTTYCAEVQGGSSMNHTSIIQDVCNGSPAQEWDYYFKSFAGF